MKELIGFIGVGNMGKPMALNLLKAGFPLVIHDINPKPLQELKEQGATIGACGRDVASEAGIVITMLPTSKDVETVILGEKGVIEGAKDGSIVVDMSTIDPSVSRRVAEQLSRKGVKMLDAPVSGGQIRAKDGTLAIMVGGDEATFRSCSNILDAMGKSIHYCGSNGSGAVAKVVNNLIAAIAGLASSEALALGVKAGVDFNVLCDVINASSGQTWAMQYYFSSKAFKNDFEPGFTAALMLKDLGLAMTLAREQEVPVLIGGLSYQIYSQVKAKGLGKKDSSIVAKLIAELAGVELHFR